MKQVKIKLLLTTITLCLTSLVSVSSLACGLHGEMSYSPFYRNHPLAQQHFRPVARENVTLKYSQMSSVQVDEVNTVELKFTTPINFSDVRLKVFGSANIELVQQRDFLLSKASGSLEVRYKATKPGEHQIFFEVKAKNNGKINDKVHTLKVVSS